MAARRSPILPILAGLAAVTALAAAVFLLLEDTPEVAPAEPQPVVAEPAPEPEAPAEPSLPVYVPEEREQPPAAEEAPTAAVSGRLVTPERLPVTRGRVTILAGRRSVFLAGGAHLEPVDVDPVEVDGEGRFHVAGLPIRGDLVLRVDGDAFVRAEFGPYVLQPGETLDAGDLVVEAGYTLVGTVFGATQRELPGAQVALSYGTLAEAFSDGEGWSRPERIVITDDEGAFRIEHAPRFPFLIAVTADGHANTVVQGGTATGDDLAEQRFTIVLEQARSLSGRAVSKEDDAPVAGLTVIVQCEGLKPGRGVATTGKDGRFTVGDLGPGPYRIDADAKGWSRRMVDVMDPEEEVLLVMTPEGAVRGRIVDPEGEPVTAFDLRVLHGPKKTVTTTPLGGTRRIRDGEGRFELRDVETGWIRLEAWARGFALTTSEPVRVRPGADVGGVTLTLQYGATMRGRVVDDLDQPIAGAKITLHENKLANVEFLRSRQWPRSWQAVQGVTDSDGVFQLTDATERVYQVQVDHPDYPVYLVDDVEATAGALTEMPTLVVPRPGTIRGTAMAADGQALRRGTVFLGGPENRQAQTDGEGRFVFRRLLPGDYHLDARPDKRSAGFDFALEVKRALESVPVRVGPGEETTTTVVAPTL